MTEKSYLTKFLYFLTVITLLSCGNACTESAKNYSERPSESYSGIWLVYSKETGGKWIKTHYVKGVKDGVETRWYIDSGYKMSEHTFHKGVLDGKYIKWRNDNHEDILVSGEYRNGKPWNGFFLEDWEFKLDSSLDTQERNVLYNVRKYVDGELVDRKKIP